MVENSSPSRTDTRPSNRYPMDMGRNKSWNIWTPCEFRAPCNPVCHIGLPTYRLSFSNSSTPTYQSHSIEHNICRLTKSSPILCPGELFWGCVGNLAQMSTVWSTSLHMSPAVAWAKICTNNLSQTEIVLKTSVILEIKGVFTKDSAIFSQIHKNIYIIGRGEYLI